MINYASFVIEVFYKAICLLKMEYAAGYKLTWDKRDPDVPFDFSKR